jgi:SAM-dependent methyltransferase
MPDIGAAAREAFIGSLSDFVANVGEAGDTFGLVDKDTPELPRYLLTLDAAAQLATTSGRDGRRLTACDLGGYFGIIAAALTKIGYATHLVDSYSTLLAGVDQSHLRRWWQTHGLTVHDIDLQAADLTLPFPDESLDVVALEAVIEHFPHTPRLVLAEVRRVLRPDGLLLLDTPNAGALGTRVGFLMHGEGLWASASDVYFSDVPFPGHTRCYSHGELTAILEWAGFVIADLRLFDLNSAPRSRSLAGRLLYEAAYPILRARYPGLRDCIWLAARPTGAVAGPLGDSSPARRGFA